MPGFYQPWLQLLLYLVFLKDIWLNWRTRSVEEGKQLFLSQWSHRALARNISIHSIINIINIIVTLIFTRGKNPGALISPHLLFYLSWCSKLDQLDAGRDIEFNHNLFYFQLMIKLNVQTTWAQRSKKSKSLIFIMAECLVEFLS